MKLEQQWVILIENDWFLRWNNKILADIWNCGLCKTIAII